MINEKYDVSQLFSWVVVMGSHYYIPLRNCELLATPSGKSDNFSLAKPQSIYLTVS